MGTLTARAISLRAPVSRPHRVESYLPAATVLGMAKAETNSEVFLDVRERT
jgi:hypothetical protein